MIQHAIFGGCSAISGVSVSETSVLILLSDAYTTDWDILDDFWPTDVPGRSTRVTQAYIVVVPNEVLVRLAQEQINKEAIIGKHAATMKMTVSAQQELSPWHRVGR